ncbi:hypothetical protein LMH87_000846 [Akanthomyces muscarius]|uniref:Uncharacterized protein n=1 Tax=Akanthomyces muscarius TaxID=2231603 RepID=A0A9W8QFC5_AKAMU|nr:hypothetical protein LMH87_000846 [Akanthomyces muscarius]KAJ4155609.1 hypothetical protein LMH87_000846 [Akanthomyces muscarius]
MQAAFPRNKMQCFATRGISCVSDQRHGFLILAPSSSLRNLKREAGLSAGGVIALSRDARGGEGGQQKSHGIASHLS